MYLNMEKFLFKILKRQNFERYGQFYNHFWMKKTKILRESAIVNISQKIIRNILSLHQGPTLFSTFDHRTKRFFASEDRRTFNDAYANSRISTKRPVVSNSDCDGWRVQIIFW